MATKKVIKKTTTAKVAPKTAAKPAVKTAAKTASPAAQIKAAPVAAAPIAATPCCGGNCGCGCRKRFWKKLLLIVIVFALGWAACCCFCCGKNGHKFGGRAHFAEMFTDGCLDLSKIQCPEKLAQIEAVAATADADKDGCITPAELKAAKHDLQK
ncbi:MAG: hypothetical protein LBJ18_02940 [Rickettsiales bacterium]|jgi:hypothetical protein|nr:hypothetical protein [Rickettsiales bacterium]